LATPQRDALITLEHGAVQGCLAKKTWCDPNTWLSI